MKKELLDLTIVIPAYNEDQIIGRVVNKARKAVDMPSFSYEIIVIDDGSQDNTAEKAKEAGARVIHHPYNIGNGAAIKTGIRNARGEVLVMLDADGQHPPEAILHLLEKIGPYDMVVGARITESDTDFHRDFGNKFYNWLASYVSNHKVEDLTSGFRAIKTDVAKGFLYLLPNRFSYPTTITLAVLRSGRSLSYVPIKARRRVGKSKIRVVRDGLRFLLIILRVATYYSPLKVFIPVSILMFLVGFGYGLFKIFVLNLPYGPTSAMLMTVSIVIFMVGLVSEQVAQLQYIRSEGFNGSDD